MGKGKKENTIRKTKIICTIGPASGKNSILEQMITGGMDIARINTSHSSRQEIIETVKKIREISARNKINTGIMLDLQGPKIRIGYLKTNIELKKGQVIVLTTTRGTPSLINEQGPVIPVTYPGFIDDIKEGGIIFIDDGLIECRIINIDRKNSSAFCRIITGGILSSQKGINLPGVTVSVSSPTRKDMEFLKLGIELEVDFIAQSFVKSAEDLLKVKKIIRQKGSPVMLIAKIEKHEAVENFNNILDSSDGVMVARGDLGIEMNAETVPHIQKEIISKTNFAGKPVITATQMLNSMIETPRPTRAEVSDVANAIIDGSDAVMLSGETAIGRYPARSLMMMERIIKETEKTLDYDAILRNKAILRSRMETDLSSITGAISLASCEIANMLKVKAIISATESGFTARQVSKGRPRGMIIGTSPNDWVVRQLLLSWGVVPVKTRLTENIDRMIEESIHASKSLGLVKKGDKVVITAGVMVNKPGSTNLINVREVY